MQYSADETTDSLEMEYMQEGGLASIYSEGNADADFRGDGSSFSVLRAALSLTLNLLSVLSIAASRLPTSAASQSWLTPRSFSFN